MINESSSIRSVIQLPNFSVVEGHLRELQKGWREDANRLFPTMEEIAINSIEFNARANAVDDILESLTAKAREQFEEIN